MSGLNLGSSPQDVKFEVLDSGYQVILTLEGAWNLREAMDWLSEQIGYELENEHVIRQIDHFQLIKELGRWHCVAVCRAYWP